MVQVTIKNVKGDTIATVTAALTDTIEFTKTKLQRESNGKYKQVRTAFKVTPKDKTLKDDVKLNTLGSGKTLTLYRKDLGPQVDYATVFYTEYAGPMIVFALVAYYYHTQVHPLLWQQKVLAACWCGHYVKRILETKFVHRFSHATMPIFNIFKNSGYYWGFALMVAIPLMHPNVTLPDDNQFYVGLVGFLLCEIGNGSIHWALRNLRPPGTKERRIPMPTGDPFTNMFTLTTSANYTYEVGIWISFNIMCPSVWGVLFTLAGFIQMQEWARNKHRMNKKQFGDAYPKNRKAIIPFVL
eukprot:Clim_evm11s230 gene=Clim_evmTU11s230